MTAPWWSGEVQAVEEGALRAGGAAADAQELIDELACVLQQALPRQVTVERDRRGRGAVRRLEIELAGQLFTCRQAAKSPFPETAVATRHGDVAGRGRRLPPAEWVTRLRGALQAQSEQLEQFGDALRGLLS